MNGFKFCNEFIGFQNKSMRNSHEDTRATKIRQMASLLLVSKSQVQASPQLNLLLDLFMTSAVGPIHPFVTIGRQSGARTG